MKDNIQEQLKLLEEMKSQLGHVKSEQEMKEELDEKERLRLKQLAEQEEQRKREIELENKRKEEEKQKRYEDDQPLIDFIKAFKQLPKEEYFMILELSNGKQLKLKSDEIIVDRNNYIGYKNPNYGFMDERQYVVINLEGKTNMNGCLLVEEQKEEIVIIKRSHKGEWQ